MTINKLPLLLALAALPVFAQANRYSATSGDVALSGAGTIFTIQKPTTQPNKDVRLESITVTCSTACSFTQTYNGANATSTAGTVLMIPPNISIPAVATAWTASNVGTAIATGGITRLYGAGSITINVGQVAIAGASTAANYNVVIATMTGTVNITVIWSEN